MVTVNEIVHDIGKLSPCERVRIVDIIMRDVIHPYKEIDMICKIEATKRWTAYKSGNSKTVSYEEVMSKYVKS